MGPLFEGAGQIAHGYTTGFRQRKEAFNQACFSSVRTRSRRLGQNTKISRETLLVGGMRLVRCSEKTTDCIGCPRHAWEIWLNKWRAFELSLESCFGMCEIFFTDDFAVKKQVWRRRRRVRLAMLDEPALAAQR